MVAFFLVVLIVVGGLVFAAGIWRDLPLLILVGALIVIFGVIQSLSGPGTTGDQSVQQGGGRRA